MPTQRNGSPGDKQWQMQVESRLSGLEGEIKSLSKLMSDSIESLGNRLGDLSSEIGIRLDGIARRFDEQSRASHTPWSVLAAWAAVVLVAVGMWSQGYIRDLSRVEAEQKILTQNTMNRLDIITRTDERVKALDRLFVQHQGEAGHPYDMAMQIAEIRTQLASITSNRFTGTDGGQLQGKIEALEARLDVLMENQVDAP